MTINAYIFAWDNTGIDSIIPITQYEQHDRDNTMRILNDEPVVRNPLNSIVQGLMLRARYNAQRCYEIFSVDCSVEMDVCDRAARAIKRYFGVNDGD